MLIITMRQGDSTYVFPYGVTPPLRIVACSVERGRMRIGFDGPEELYKVLREKVVAREYSNVELAERTKPTDTGDAEREDGTIPVYDTEPNGEPTAPGAD